MEHLVTTHATHQIVEFLLVGDNRADAAARLLSETGRWKEALALAGAWKVIPQLSARIQSLKVKLPAADTGTLRREFVRVYAQSATRAAQAIAAIQELEHAGIRVVAFKGLASMAVLYGDPKHRTIGDADLLILPKDLAGALACLERRGFARRGSETLSEYLRFVDHAPRFAGNKAIALYAADGAEIDLHWELAGSGLGVEGILERANTARLMDATIPVVDSKDGFLLTVHHAIREDLGIESICRDLLDARLWCDHLQATRQIEAGMKWAADSGCRVPALALTSLLGSHDDATAAALAAALLRDSASAAECGSAARLTELFHYQIRNGRLGKDVLYLVHSRPWRQILKGLGTDWSGYRRSMRTLDQQLDQEKPLLERAVLLAKSIPGPRGLRLARTLARVKYAPHGKNP
jgi:hypothetical protein